MERQFVFANTIIGILLLPFLLTTASAGTLVGNTSGSFAVSASGDATYALGLKLPAGTAGMTPQFALVYSGGAGDGIAGWGWNASGFSSIYRCAATYAQNGEPGAITYTNSDRLCLDGNQLMLHSGSYLASGAVYRGELDDFTKVTQSGSGSSISFKVEFPNGRIAYFGTTSDSRKLKDGSSAILEWAISRIEDRSPNRNYIEFVYSDDPGGKLLPEAVKYTGSYANAPYYTVDFVYQSRPAAETRPRYRAGSAAGYAKRLDRIDIKTSAQLVRRYALSYESSLSPVTKRSRLASIQECGIDAVDCFRPITFEWLDANGTRGETSLTYGMYYGSRWADINGDGLDDAVVHSDEVGGVYTKMSYYLSVGTGETTNGSTDIEWDNEQAAGAFLLDYDRNGKTDVAFGWTQPWTEGKAPGSRIARSQLRAGTTGSSRTT